MDTAYIDCYYGITPRKLLAAILDMGTLNAVRKEMLGLGIPFKMTAGKRFENGALYTELTLENSAELRETNITEIYGIINTGRVKPGVKKMAKAVFMEVAEAESVIHREPAGSVHLFEVGHPSAILAVTGIAAGLEALGIKKMFFSVLSLGSGMIKCSHGVLRVPVPAVREITKNMPVAAGPAKKELTTPLGAAIAKTFCVSFGSFPSMKTEKTGRGSTPGAAGPLIVYAGRE